MINQLKKFSKTFEKFEKYMEKFDDRENGYSEFYAMPQQIEIHDNLNCLGCFKMPEQFLIGCLLEFLAENKINISIHSMIEDTIILNPLTGEMNVCTSKERIFFEAFKIMETQL